MKGTVIAALVAAALLALPALTLAIQTGDAGDEELQEAGRSFNSSLADYQRYCQSCHGKEGRGDGSVAKWLKDPPPDLTQMSERHGGEFPAELATRVVDGREEIKAHGPREMPIWGKVLSEDASESVAAERIAGLVEVLRWVDRKGPPSAG